MATRVMTAQGEAWSVDDLPRLFGDGAGEPLVNYGALDLERVNAQIRTDGYAIVHDVVPVERAQAIRAFWLKTFQQPGARERVTWAPYLGQANVIGFSRDKFQCLYRSCDFQWNEPYEPTTRAVCLRLNALRNLILGVDPLSGVTFSPGRYGVFVTTSYYPPGEGWLKIHADGVAPGRPLLHHIAPLTIKGTDYAEGGLVMIDRGGKRVDVDGQMRLGSVLFYDGALEHGVERIVPSPEKRLGRLQMFAIPTTFTNAELNVYTVGKVPVRTFVQAKWMRLKNRLLVTLGFDPIIR